MSASRAMPLCWIAPAGWLPIPISAWCCAATTTRPRRGSRNCSRRRLPAAARRSRASTPSTARSSPRWRRSRARIGRPLSRSRVGGLRTAPRRLVADRPAAAAGAVFAAALAYLLARRMIGPIRLLGQGADAIGAGHFDHKIDISTGDELEGLAQRFNEMAVELALSQERSERIARLKRFLAPQVAELVEGSDQEICSTATAPKSSRSSAICAASPAFRTPPGRKR